MNNSAQQLHIKVTGDAYILQNETGTAVYTKKGVGMFKINGQGLPDNIEVHDQSSKSECSEGTFHIKDGQVFIKDANATRMIFSISEVMNPHVEATLTEQEQKKFRELVSEAVKETLRKEQRPGGKLWGMQSGGGSLSRCKLIFGDTKLPAFGGFPSPKRKLAITISGLEEWKGGIVSGTTVIVNILQGDKIIHSELFSGKASGGYTRQVEVSATKGDLVVAHNRPDLPHLKITAEFVE